MRVARRECLAPLRIPADCLSESPQNPIATPRSVMITAFGTTLLNIMFGGQSAKIEVLDDLLGTGTGVGHLPPVGTRCFNSSNQLRTMLMRGVTGSSAVSVAAAPIGIVPRNLWPSAVTS